MPRRTLSPFGSFAEAHAESERLLQHGYTSSGKWTLGQCCGHLANWVHYQMDGFPRLPLLMRPPFFIVRHLMGTSILKEVLAKGVMREGSMTAPQSVPPVDTDDAAAVAAYQQATARWDAFTGEFYSSPMFGRQPRETWRQLHLLHAAHHLSYLTPNHA
ncbi:MAG: DUF1569 domain-containing protein [Gemmataceae bacterium]